MNILIIRNDNLDEIVFENRNKNYGAYDLRKSYESHLLKAGCYVTAAILLLFLISRVYAMFHQQPIVILKNDALVLTAQPTIEMVIELPPPPKTPVARIENIQPVNSNGKMEIVKNTAPTVENIVPPATTTTNSVEGSTSPSSATIGTGATLPTTPSIIPTINSEATTTPDVMPEFPGGDTRMREYLENAIRYPNLALSLGVEGKVLLTFVVNKNGTVSQIKVEHSLGYDCDEEAIRVLKEMPKWNPGKINGEPVSVKCTLPIRFALR